MYNDPNRRRASEDEEVYEEGDDKGRGRGLGRRIRVCQFCAEKIAVIDYKQADLLRKYITDRGKIRPRRQTGACARHQRALTVAVKRARHMAILPYTAVRLR